MKPVCFVLLSVLLLFTCFSCKKDKAPINGQWRWTYTFEGGIAGGTVTPSSGTVVSLTLGSNLIYTTYLNNEIAAQGTYYYTASGNTSIIHFDKPITIDKLFLKGEETIFKQGSDTLTFSDSWVEGSSSLFVKIK